ncbi:MAG TPA: sigma 54-interacting transcriptional regulator, partial [Longimicrobiaceae bacterium]|nr:sigma 54-interacting transcriptional regulator [Longimicrobiaceae bacterium]
AERTAPDAAGTPTGWSRVVGASAAIRRVREVGAQVAQCPATVLITGESGSGKEVVARAIHETSPRSGGPFVAVSCAAIPDPLTEAELFGYEEGAFTGAVQARAGRFEEAQGGTLFLDEVTELGVERQAKLLRVLQERAVRRLGSNRSIPLDVRIVAASNRDLRRAMWEGRMRADLYYRLRVVEIGVPPLRERTEDLLPLSLHFLRSIAAVIPHALQEVSLAALEEMEAYGWPGNVRELENVIARIAVLASGAGGVLLPCHLPDEVRRASGQPADAESAAPLDLAAAMRRVRLRYLGEALRVAHGNRSEAARLLGISRRALYDLLNEFPGAGSLPSPVPPLSHTDRRL